ncbi:MAG: metallophosphoesterase [Sedimentisphaerales bacterium]|nr:metallophosphoesterase [Sedimentisphaerales bacterium]
MTHRRTITAGWLWLLLMVGALAGAAGPVQTFPSGPCRRADNVQLDPNRFHFVVIADRTGGHRPGVFAGAIHKVNLLQPEFVVCIGDLIEGYTTDPNRIEQQWSEFERIIEPLEMPFYYLPGNHDISNPVMLAAWKHRFNRTYYHFLHKEVLFLCLNTEGGQQAHRADWIDDEQRAYFGQVLQDHRRVRWTLVFLHKPLWESDESGWRRFETLLADRPYTVFAGHKHQYAHQIRHGRRYIRLATTGGSNDLAGVSSQRDQAIRIGKFDHLLWVTMTGQGPRIANLMLDGLFDEQTTPLIIAQAAEFIKDQIQQNRLIQIEPIHLAADGPDKAAGRIRITNPTIVPMSVRIEPVSQGAIRLNPDETTRTVPPFSQRTIRLDLQTESPDAIGAGQTIEIPLPIRIAFWLPAQEPYACTLIRPVTILGQ